MSNYTKTTNFASKDNLSPGNPLKIVKGTEIDTEFNNIATAIATKTDNSAAAITGGSITGITDLAIADGGTGASTATAAINNLLPSQTSNANKYLQTDGTNVSWDAVSLSTADITGTLPVANGGTGVTSSTGTGSVVLSNSPTLVTPALGTPASGVATNLTGLPLSTGVTGTLPIANGGTGQTTANAAFNALAPSQATASGKYLKSDGTNTSWDALDISTADITGTLPVANGGTGVTTSTGTGSVVLSNSPTLVTPALGTPSSATLTNATGLPISTGVSGLGTGVATALAVNVGSAGAPVVNGGALGTPSSGTVTNLTGTASININGTVGATTPTTGAFTTLTTSSTVTLNGGTANGVSYLDASKVLTTGSALWFDGTNFGVGTGGNTLNQQSVVYKVGANAVYQQIANGSTGLGAANGVRLGVSNGGTGELYSPTALISYIDNSEQMRLTSTGLGIGTSSPLAKLHVRGTTNGNLLVRGGASAASGLTGTALSSINDAASATVSLTFEGSDFNFVENNAVVAKLDSAGNLGLGVTPSAWKSGAKAFQLGATGYASLNEQANGSTSLNFNCYESAANTWTYYVTGVAPTRYTQLSGAHAWFNAPSGTAGNAISFTQAMSLTADGTLLVGKTSSNNGTNGAQLSPTTQFFTNTNDYIALFNRKGTDGVSIYFQKDETNVGNISVTTSATAYNTSSDYRLKNITGPITTSGAYIDSLNPVEGTWKADGATFVGLIAHEVQEASRTQVATGTKDGVEMQAMDYSNSELIANLIAEVKSLRQRVATLEAK